MMLDISATFFEASLRGGDRVGMSVVAHCLYNPRADDDGEYDEEDRHHETRERVGGYDERSYGKPTNQEPVSLRCRGSI
jgi:hypothetical protein